MSRSYKFYGTTAATSNALAQIQVLAGARIKSVRWRIGVDAITDGGMFYVELSTQGVGQPTINNPSGIISCMRVCANFVTSGLDLSGLCQQDLIDCPVGLGQILYLNTYVPAGTITAFVDCFVDCTA